MIVVIAFTLFAHWPALSAGALSFDDQQYLIRNYLVQHPSWLSAKRFLCEVLEPSTVDGYYQPLAMISLMLDSARGGSPSNLRPFHQTSLILHVANTVLMAWLLYRLFGKPWPAAIVGILFGVHPMTVEPIPWIGERKTVLATFFALGSLIAYVRYARHTVRSRDLTASSGSYAACVVLYVLALMSKPTVTPLPLALLLMDIWPLKRFDLKAILEKIPLFAITVLSAVITYISQARTSGASLPTEHSPWRIPLILCHNIIFYPMKMLWPSNLSSHYAFPQPLDLTSPMVLAGVIGTLMLLALLLFSLRYTRIPVIGWLIWFLTILPTMQIIGFSNVIASDKYTYFPVFGLLMVLAWYLGRLWDHATGPGRRPVVRGLIVAVTLGLACAYISTARTYLTCWSDTVTLYRYMLGFTPNAWPLHDTLAYALAEQGNIRQAREHWKLVENLNPYPYVAHYNQGIAHLQQKQLSEAKKEFETALKIYPNYLDAHNNLGFVLAMEGNLPEAIQHFTQALSLKPDDPESNYNMGLAMLDSGKPEVAVQHFETVLKYCPDDQEAQMELNRARDLLKKRQKQG